jgi:ABC-2 type transport system ATP-binding protein
MTQSAILETNSLGKRYGSISALHDCTLTIDRGEVFGLLGPNGAGKTTLLRLLLGFLRPTTGKASIDGLDCYRQSVGVRKIVSYLPGEARMFRQMRGREVLRFFAEIRPLGDFARSLRLADQFELDTSVRVAFMSTGMRQKLALVTALAAETPLLILDEPTANLDPTVRQTTLELVAEAKSMGRTVIFSSHVLSEVEEVCDRVVILRRAQIAHLQLMQELRRQHRIHLQLAGPLPCPPASLQSELMVTTINEQQVVIDTAGELSPLLGWLATVPIREVTVESVGLRPVYDRFHPKTPTLPRTEST